MSLELFFVNCTQPQQVDFTAGRFHPRNSKVNILELSSEEMGIFIVTQY